MAPGTHDRTSGTHCFASETTLRCINIQSVVGCKDMQGYMCSPLYVHMFCVAHAVHSIVPLTYRQYIKLAHQLAPVSVTKTVWYVCVQEQE